MACEISYIRQSQFSETEKQRLEEIHVSIFKQAKASKAFRETNNRLQAIKSKYADATAFVGEINNVNGAQITVLNSIGNGNAVLNVNVLPLSKEIQGNIFLSKTPKQRLSPSEYFEKRYNPVTRYTGPRDKAKWKSSLENLKMSLEQTYVSERNTGFGEAGVKVVGKIGSPVPITLPFIFFLC